MKRNVFSFSLKKAKDFLDLISIGREFHNNGPATEKALFPYDSKLYFVSCINMLYLTYLTKEKMRSRTKDELSTRRRTKTGPSKLSQT